MAGMSWWFEEDVVGMLVGACSGLGAVQGAVRSGYGVGTILPKDQPAWRQGKKSLQTQISTLSSLVCEEHQQGFAQSLAAVI